MNLQLISQLFRVVTEGAVLVGRLIIRATYISVVLGSGLIE